MLMLVTPISQEGLRERKKLRVRTQLTEAALALFSEHGFEATTVDDIVEKVEVSRRTFFRYFDSKEDVVLDFTDRVGEEVRASLVARPPGEPPLTAVRHALAALVAVYSADRDRALLLARLATESPAIRARRLDKQAGWQPWLAGEIARRLLLAPDRDLLPQLIAAITLAVVEVAVRIWLADRGRTSLGALVDNAFDAIEAGLDRLPPAATEKPPRQPLRTAKRSKAAQK
jgi:AcrR family transcriptional regulator